MTVPWYWVVIFAFIITLLENLLPPIPGDSALIFIGTLIGLGVVNFPLLVLASTLGGTAGFAIMYKIGSGFERKVVESGKIKFINVNSIITVENWFRQYGMWIIIGNRFISGIRAVIAFFAGMSKIDLTKSIILSFVSSLIWNSILLFLGAKFGDNWKMIDDYFTMYGNILFPIFLVIAILIIWYILRKNKNTNNTNNSQKSADNIK